MVGWLTTTTHESEVTVTAETLATEPKLLFRDAYATVFHGDCLDVMPMLPSESVDAVVTDPPYGLTEIDEDKTRLAINAWIRDGNDSFVPDGKGFMGKRWDQFVPPPAAWREALRLVRPGGYLLCFAGSRTLDLMTLSIRLGGFDVLGTMEWAYGQGMPKSMDVAKGIDKRSGFVGEVVGTEEVDTGMQGGKLHTGRPKNVVTRDVRALSPEATAWAGWFTSLKPAHEPIVVARKPAVGGEGVPERALPAFIYRGKAKTDERPTYVADDGTIISHPTVKPVELVRDLVSLVCPRGGVVLDPFLGSGTTCEAAKTNGMDSVGIELHDAHLPLITERLAGRDNWAGGLLD